MNPMIQIEHVSKIFETKEGNIHALNDISLSIEKGEICGIIGMSGAGKSTLVRCLNFLEKPSEGTVLIDGKDLSAMSEQKLRKERTEISMIFQHFNLIMQKNVLENVCFPLKIVHTDKVSAKKKARELLNIVGLSDKAKAYPAQLSGGEKQRVAIARALATNPKILLCDEATSALDPQTTRSILQLLKDINQKYGITIVIITHQMSVVQQICSKVAIIDKGILVETGDVAEVFANPKSPQARHLIWKDTKKTVFLRDSKCIRIVFNSQSSFEPVISNMVLEYKTPVNIMYANTRDIGGVAKGEMILQLPDEPGVAGKMIQYLNDTGVSVQEQWEEDDRYVFE